MRARACSGSDQQCLGNSTEADVCKISECPGINWLFPLINSYNPHCFFQPSMQNGKSGVNGPNVQLLVGRVPKSGPEHAVNLPLEAVSSVVEIQQRPGIVAQLNAQVNL